MPWTVSRDGSLGTQVATGGGFGSRVDWSWDARVATAGRYTWAIRAGPTLRPATGSVVAGSGSGPDSVVAVSAQPATSSARTATASPTRPPSATRWARPQRSRPPSWTATGLALATLFSEAKPAGRSPSAGWPTRFRRRLQRADLGEDARRPRGDCERARSRSTGRCRRVFTSPKFVSPNADGRADSLRVAFTLAADADVDGHRAFRLGRPWRPRSWPAGCPAGPRTVDWDGKIAGVPIPDGSYQQSSSRRRPLTGTASQPTKLVVDTAAPVLRLVSAFKAPRHAQEPATVTTVVDGNMRTFVRRKAGALPDPGAELVPQRPRRRARRGREIARPAHRARGSPRVVALLELEQQLRQQVDAAELAAGGDRERAGRRRRVRRGARPGRR